MSKRKFRLEFEGSAIVEIDDAVFSAVDDEWRKQLYDLDDLGIAEMVGRCLSVQGMRLSSLDGWADQPNSNARVLSSPDWETTSVEEIES